MVAGDFWYTDQAKEFDKERAEQKFAQDQKDFEEAEKIREADRKIAEEAINWSVRGDEDSDLQDWLFEVKDPRRTIELYIEWKRVLKEEAALGHSSTDAHSKAKARIFELLQ